MRAALLTEFKKPFVVEDIDYLDPAPRRVLVRTGASPFCSTDCGNWPHVANRKTGEPVSAAGNVGGYAEVMNVTASQVFPVESDLPDEWLSLLGCGITSGVGAVLNVAKVE